MSASNGYEGDVEGTVKVCFDNPLESYLTPSVDTATMEMKVEGLPATIAGGVHIHAGTSCDSTSTQGPHYWNPALGVLDLGPKADGDAWFMQASSLAPTGTGYITDDDGEGEAKFFVNNGYGFDDNEGKVVVVHGETKLTGGSYARIACGVLVED